MSMEHKTIGKNVAMYHGKSVLARAAGVAKNCFLMCTKETIL